MGKIGWGLTIACGAMALLILLVSFLRRPRKQVLLYYQCQKCGQRLGYQSRQIGHKGKCPRCKLEFSFPPPGLKKR
jgi:hypothetical protein